jgi:hypothetical protein
MVITGERFFLWGIVFCLADRAFSRQVKVFAEKVMSFQFEK